MNNQETPITDQEQPLRQERSVIALKPTQGQFM